MKSKKSALVVLSGGQDSTTCLFWAKKYFEKVHAVSFDYGQRHRIELESARIIASMAQVNSFEIIQLPGLLHSTSPLTSGNELEQYRDAEHMEHVIGDRVELTFVPMRNTMFLTVASNRAVELGCNVIVTGICGEDNANYPDCTEPFRYSFERMLNISLGTADRFKIEAPLMFLSKAQSIVLAQNLPGCMDALAYSHTSYDGKYPPTDMNHANVLRAAGFEEAGVPDPLVLRACREGLMNLPETPNYEAERNGRPY